MNNLTKEEKAAAREEYFKVADDITAILDSVKAVYPDLPKQLNALIGKYVELHMKIYS